MARQHVRGVWLAHQGPTQRRSGRARGGGAADAARTPEQVQRSPCLPVNLLPNCNSHAACLQLCSPLDSPK